jgi:hypothetical protein
MTKDPVLFKKIAYMRNFWPNGPGGFAELGLNAKNSELAAMGLNNLGHIQKFMKGKESQSVMRSKVNRI